MNYLQMMLAAHEAKVINDQKSVPTEESPRFAAKSILLTYADCPTPEEFVLEQVRAACSVRSWDIIQ